MGGKRKKGGSGRSGTAGWWQIPLVGVVLCVVSWLAIGWVAGNGYVLWFGDAQAHLTIARRIIDSRTPGLDQIGTVWLPLPHLLMLPLVKVEGWWESGLAGSYVGGACFVLAGMFLFAAVRLMVDSAAAGAAAVALFVGNPNVLYLQATPMTEPVMQAALMALLYAVVAHGKGGGWGMVLLAAGAVNAASWTRYEGWFLIPFVGLLIVSQGGRRGGSRGWCSGYWRG